MGFKLQEHSKLSCFQVRTSFFTCSRYPCAVCLIWFWFICRVPQDMNCLRIVESVAGVDARSKHLRSTIANQMLVVLLKHKVNYLPTQSKLRLWVNAFIHITLVFESQESDENLMSSLMSINLKEKSCNLFRTYMMLVLAENWLLSSKLVEEKPVLREMWAVFLRNCFCQINSTDLRPFASKVSRKIKKNTCILLLWS